MRRLSSYLKNLIDAGGPFVGANKGSSRVTVEPNWYLRATTGQVGSQPATKLPVRTWQLRDNSQIELELPNIKSVVIDRTLDQDAATLTLELYNQQMDANVSTGSIASQLGEPGFFSWTRGQSDEAKTRWGQFPNEWADKLGPNALFRVYQGYGGQDLTIKNAVAAGNIMLTGVFLVDTVTLQSNGIASFTCRDMAKLLIDQQCYPPLVPRELYQPVGISYHLTNADGKGTAGNYADYTDIVKDLLLWSGWLLFDQAQLVSTLAPAVFGNMENTGANDVAGGLIESVFDKRPIIDIIKTIRDIVGYIFRIDETGAAHFESPNWWSSGNFYDDPDITGNRRVPNAIAIPVLDERVNLSNYTMAASDAPLRSEIIVTVVEPTVVPDSGLPTVAWIPPNIESLRGMVKPLMMGAPTDGSATVALETIFAELVSLQIWFQSRQGSVTTLFNPAISVDTQVQIYERVTGETYIHYVRGVHTSHDLETGAFTMTLTTHWLGNATSWAITSAAASFPTQFSISANLTEYLARMTGGQTDVFRAYLAAVGTPVPPVDPPFVSGGGSTGTPTNSTLPFVIGVAQVGLVMGVDNGTWTNTPTSFTYQWTANATVIAGATAATYTVAPADLGAVLAVRVTATNATGSNSATSAPTAAVTAAGTVIVGGSGGGGGGAGGGVGPAHTANGGHVDNNIYGNPPNSTAAAFALGEAFTGVNYHWGMIECSPDPSVEYGILLDLTNDAAGNFKDGRTVPKWCFTFYGEWIGHNMANIAAGGLDTNIIDICTVINSIPFPQVSIRWGWEVDGGWFSWGSSASQYIAAFQHVVTLFRAHITHPLLIEWNSFAIRGAPTVTNGYGFNSTDYYPGDAYVDVVGCDAYVINIDATDTGWLATMQAAQAFALAHGKQVAYSEWGLWDAYGGSAATMEASGRSVNAMTAALAFFDSLPSSGAGSLAYQLYFDGNPGTGLFSWQNFPRALAVYQARMAQP